MFSEFLKGGNNRNTLFCFSPAVMLATFIIEFSLAVYVFVRYRMTRFGQLATATLIFLGIFQVAEYQICGGNSGILWARIGYVAITMLPPLGLHLISLITGDSKYVKFSYTLAAVYTAAFLFAEKSIVSAACTGNYVIFNTVQELYWTYGIYYTGFLMLGVWELVENIRECNEEDFSLRAWMALGYFSFMVPMAAVYMVFPETRDAVPSVMCGFAVTLALLMAFIIVPKYNKRKS